MVGHWQNSKRLIKLVLHEDGSAETTFKNAESYPGTWRFSAPHQLLVRQVIPLNNPMIDDELNANEMCFEIRDFEAKKFTAEEYDFEGLQEFVKI